jgi:Ca2+-transporting ATPase
MNLTASQIAEEHWHTLEQDRVAQVLQSDRREGLTPESALERLSVFGANAIGLKRRINPVKIFFAQFLDVIVLVLIGALVVAAILGEWIDSLAILTIVILNAILGFTQEFRAEKALAKLREMASPHARVVRGGVEMDISSTELVPGDLMLLETGDAIPADGRLLEQTGMSTQESALTGESETVDKSISALSDPKLPLGDRLNLVYQGTTVTSGRGKAMVIATGLATELGKIASLVQEAEEEPTPLQKRLDALGKKLLYLILSICAVIFALGLLRQSDVTLVFLTAVSLAVAAIPEGLPAVVTIAMALGVQRMANRKALIRKLTSVETLGSTTYICTDKTGTLTQNKMEIAKVFVPGAGEIDLANPENLISPSVKRILNIGALSNNIYLKSVTVDHSIHDMAQDGLLGDPMEIALIEKAIATNSLEEFTHEDRVKLIDELPFDSNRKRMSVVFGTADGCISLVKGAPDVLLPRCSSVYEDGKVVPLTSESSQKITRANEELADRALRVIAVAERDFPYLHQGEDKDAFEEELTFVGLIALRDPPRPEAYQAVQKCRSAGITPIMVTGDHLATALAIGRELNIYTEGDLALTGRDLDEMDDREFYGRIKQVKLFARVSPEHKLRVVKALKEHGEIVAMTGDGVNDAPAITEADIGVAMGLKGTDVTREASDMVLLDDNFATIVSAVEEGRRIYDNLAKFIHYLLSCNTGEVLTMLVASLAGLPLPLFPVQLLWVNLITDGIPALALGVEPAEPNLLSRPPRNPQAGFLRGRELGDILLEGTTIGIATLAIFIFELFYRSAALGPDLAYTYAQTSAFSVLVVSQLFHSLNCRSLTMPLHRVGLFGNRFLILSFFGSLAIHIMVIYTPFLQTIFKVTALSAMDFTVVMLFSMAPLFGVQTARILRQWWGSRK